MDALTEILRAMRLLGGVFLDARFSAPWCILSQVTPEDCQPFMAMHRKAMPRQLIAYHYVVEGRLILNADGRPPVTAGAGHLFVLPRNDAHVLASAEGLEPADINPLIEPAGADGVASIRYGGGGAPTRILCGFLGNDEVGDPLIASLPSLMQLDLTATSTGAWVEGSMRHAMQALARDEAGAVSSLGRLSELLFAEAIREYVRGMPEEQRGWLGGLRDPVVSRALALMHAQLDAPWTLERLSREVGASRSVLTDHFARSLGDSPMHYLRRRRLARAAEQLTGSARPVSEIALAAGYESEGTFSRLFKREYGSAPSAFRKATRG